MSSGGLDARRHERTLLSLHLFREGTRHQEEMRCMRRGMAVSRTSGGQWRKPLSSRPETGTITPCLAFNGEDTSPELCAATRHTQNRDHQLTQRKPLAPTVKMFTPGNSCVLGRNNTSAQRKHSTAHLTIPGTTTTEPLLVTRTVCQGATCQSEPRLPRLRRQQQPTIATSQSERRT